MKGIVLAGGSGSRLYPMTKAISKQLIPIYDKPTIYYPLSILMLAGIREILIISTPRDVPMIESLLGTGSELGLRFEYKVQERPGGIAEAFILAEDYLENEPVCLILGDNFFYGDELTGRLSRSAQLTHGAQIFAYHVNNPQEFGVIEFDKDFRPLSIVEKPAYPKSNWAITGLYFYDGRVSSIARGLERSARGELEITDINRAYLNRGQLEVKTIGRGVAWLDTGTPESLISSAQFVQTIENRQGQKIACLEEIAFVKGYITKEQLREAAARLPECSYSKYLHGLIARGLI